MLANKNPRSPILGPQSQLLYFRPGAAAGVALEVYCHRQGRYVTWGVFDMHVQGRDPAARSHGAYAQVVYLFQQFCFKV